MILEKVTIEGFANIDKVELHLNKFNALIALNNYGKSNIIAAIHFGINFMKEPSWEKNDMMAYKPFIPINKYIDNKSFRFELTFITDFSNEKYTVMYAYSFDWIKNDNTKGQRIKEEILQIKPTKADSKFKAYISRNLENGLYLPSPTGRCDKKLVVQKNELIINKLKNFDDLFYINIIDELNTLNIIQIDALEHPDTMYGRMVSEVVQPDYSLNIPNKSNIAFFIYSLKKQRPHLYELFKDAVMSLLPGIESFEAVEVDLKEYMAIKEGKGDVPFYFPEKLHDIRVKEIHNNQQTSVKSLSAGSQKVFYVLALTLSAEINKIPLLTLEELENSIHPGLLQKLIMVLDGLAEHTKVILTSHSPYLIQYLKIDAIKIGIPNNNGLAVFKEIRKSKFNKAMRVAEEEGVSVGDLIFDEMIEGVNGSSEFLNELCK